MDVLIPVIAEVIMMQRQNNVTWIFEMAVNTH